MLGSIVSMGRSMVTFYPEGATKMRRASKRYVEPVYEAQVDISFSQPTFVPESNIVDDIITRGIEKLALDIARSQFYERRDWGAALNSSITRVTRTTYDTNYINSVPP